MDTAVARSNARLALPGQGKVKFFGCERPPKCALRDCWLTDDGHTFYCTDFSCNRHKHRRTKHDRYSRFAHRSSAPPLPAPEAPRDVASSTSEPPSEGLWPLLHLRCPQCQSLDLQMRLLQNRYECMACAYSWR